MRRAISIAAAMLFASLLIACVIAGRARAATHATAPAQRLYVTNPDINSVTIYALGKFGNLPTLAGYTNLTDASGIARDAAGNIYATNPANDTITVYARGAYGIPNPIATISGTGTRLDYPVGIAVDAQGKIFVANEGVGADASVTVYRPRSSGNVTPIAIISGDKTMLSRPSGLALDSAGKIYVSNLGGQDERGSVTVYGPRSAGNVEPTRVIGGSLIGPFFPTAITVNKRGDIYMTNDAGTEGTATVEMIPAGSTGNVAPTEVILGVIPEDCGGLNGPDGVAVDRAGNIFVADSDRPAGHSRGNIAIYAGHSDGCIPIACIAGPATGLSQPAGLTVDSRSRVYVADLDSNNRNGIAVFAPLKPRRSERRRATHKASFGAVFEHTFTAGAGMTSVLPAANSCAEAKRDDGNIAPIQTIANLTFSMDDPAGITFDKSGKIYVTNEGSRGGFDSITIYPAGSDLNVAPIATIVDDQGSARTGLYGPGAIAVDEHGDIYVANANGNADGSGSITVYAPGSNGNVAPLRTIAGARTGLNQPIGLALDSAGYLYVLNQAGGADYTGSVTIYAPGSNGNAAPVRTISRTASADRTGIVSPSGMALDRDGNIYITNQIVAASAGEADSVTIYAAGSNGNVAPIATIAGRLTQLDTPTGIAIDSIGNIFVANSASGGGTRLDSITVYPPGSHGDVAPAMRLRNGKLLRNAVIKGARTGLDQPQGIALGPGA